MVEELQPGVLGVDRLTKRDLDAVDRILQEELLSARGGTFGVVGGESAGKYAHPQEEGTRFLLASAKRTGSMLVHLRSIESKNA